MYFFLPFLNGVKACCIKCLSATSFELKYVGDESGPFIYFTADIRYFSLQHGSRIHQVKYIFEVKFKEILKNSR